MSFGGVGGGQVRYALIVDDQATAKLNTFKTSLTNVGGTTVNVSRNVNTMNQSLSAGVAPIKAQGDALTSLNASLKTTTTASTTLTNAAKSTTSQLTAGISPIKAESSALLTLNSNIKSTSSQFSSSVSPIKNAGNAMSKLSGDMTNLKGKFSATISPIKNTGDALNQLGKTQKSLTSQLSTIGSGFKNNALAIGAAASSVLGLYQNYANLSSAQNAANKSATAAKAAQINLAKAQDNLNKAIDKYGAGSKEAKTAQDKLTVAQERAATKAASAEIAQDNLNQTMADFGINILPNIILAGGSVVSIFDNISLKGKSLTGVISKIGAAFTGIGGGGGNFGGLGTSIDNIGEKLKAAVGPGNSLKATLIGIGATAGAIGLVTAGAIELGNAMNKVASAFSNVKQPVSGLEAIIDKSGKSLKAWNLTVEETEAAARAGVSPMMVAFDAVFGTHMTEQILRNAGALDKNGKILVDFGKATKEVVKPNQDLAAAQEAVNKAMANPALKSHDKTTRDMAQSTLAHAKAELERQKALDATDNTTVKLGKDIKIYAGAELQAGQAVGKTTEELTHEAEILTVGTNRIIQRQKELSDFNTATLKANKALQDESKRIEEENKTIGTNRITQRQKELSDFNEATLKANKAAAEESNRIEEENFVLGTNRILKRQQELSDFFTAKLAAEKAAAEESKRIEEDLATIGTNRILAQQQAISDWNEENLKLIKTFGPLNKVTLLNDDIRQHLLAIQDKQINGYKEEESNILDLAAANDVYSAELANLASAEGDHVAEMNNLLAVSINYTSALDDQNKNQKLVSEGFRDGVIQGKVFFDNLVKGTEQEGTFSQALAFGAKHLGIQSDLLAFSSGKMQQLIKDTYEQSKAYDRQALAASKSTAFLNDQVLILGQVNKGMIDGGRAANDWAISNTKATAEGFAFHDQLVKITADMLGLPIPINASNEALQKAQTTFEGTLDAGLALAEMMTDKLAPSFDRVSGIIQSKDMKELRDNLKKMELPPGFKHGLDDAFKPLRGAAEEARQLGNAMDILVTAGGNMSKKDLTKNMKAFGNELDRISKIKGTSAPVDAILNSLKTMSPEQLGQHTDSIQFLVDTINKFGQLPKDKAKEFIDMYNKEIPEMGPSSITASKGVDALADSLLKIAEINFDPSKFIADPNNTKKKGVFKSTDPSLFNSGQNPKITLDTSEANRALSALIKRIDTISNMKPAPALNIGPANQSLSALIKRIDSINNMKPAFQLNTKPANNALSSLIKRIDSIDNMKPAPKLNTKPANSALSSLIKRIDSIDNMKPALHLNTKPANSELSKLINRIDTINNMHPTVHVGISGPGASVASKGDTSGSKMDSSASKFSTGMGTSGDIIIENHTHVMDMEVVRRVKAEQGKNRYRFGLG